MRQQKGGVHLEEALTESTGGGGNGIINTKYRTQFGTQQVIVIALGKGLKMDRAGVAASEAVFLGENG